MERIQSILLSAGIHALILGGLFLLTAMEQSEFHKAMLLQSNIVTVGVISPEPSTSHTPAPAKKQRLIGHLIGDSPHSGTVPSPSTTREIPLSGEENAVTHRGAVGVRYETALAAKLAREKRYPREARRDGDEGNVRIRIVIDRSGRVKKRQLVESSGSSSLDREVELMVDRADPFPAIPQELPENEYAFIAPVKFKLSNSGTGL